MSTGGQMERALCEGEVQDLGRREGVVEDAKMIVGLFFASEKFVFPKRILNFALPKVRNLL